METSWVKLTAPTNIIRNVLLLTASSLIDLFFPQFRLIFARLLNKAAMQRLKTFMYALQLMNFKLWKKVQYRSWLKTAVRFCK